MKKTAWWRLGALVIALATTGVYPAAAEYVFETNADEDRSFQGTGAAAVFVSDTVGYAFYLDVGNINGGQLWYAKTTDGGATWPTVVAFNPQMDIVGFGIWYDRWTPGDTTGTKIHVTFFDRGDDRLLYDFLDTSGDTQRGGGAVFIVDPLGNVNANDGHPSITKSTDGDLYVFAAALTQGVWESIDAGENWLSTSASFLDDTFEQGNLMPLSGGDVLLTWLDCPCAAFPASYNLRSRVLDDSGTWDGSSLTVGSINLDSINSSTFWGASVFKATGDVYLALDTNTNRSGSNADIETYLYDEGAGTWSPKTNVLTNNQDGLMDAKITIDEGSGDIYAVYLRGYTSGDVYYKKSTDGMATWGPEQRVSDTSQEIRSVRPTLMSGDRLYTLWYDNANDDVIGDTIVDLVTSVYYSVGDSRTTSTDLKTGGPTVTISNGVALLSVAQTGDIGLGDEINYGAGTLAYIKSVLSQTQFIVHTATGGVPANVTDATVNSIMRAFDTLGNAEANSGNSSYLNNFDLTASGANATLTWVAYKDADFTGTMTINGYTTDASHFLTLTAASASQVASGASQRHSGRAATGVLLDGQTSSIGIHVRDDYTVIEWLDFKDHSGGAESAVKVETASNVLLNGLIIRDANMAIKAESGTQFTVRNSVLYNSVEAVHDEGATVLIENCTVFGISLGDGAIKGTNYTVRNTISMNNVGADFKDMPVGNLSYNISEDGTASCGTCLPDHFFTDVPTASANFVVFTNLTGGSEDFHLQSSSVNDAIDTGTDLSGTFTNDIDDETRGASWDIGADEGSSSGIIYYSVGTDTSALYSDTASASTGVLTLNSAAANNIGVGDEIREGANRYYITGRNSSTEFTIQNSAANGGTPGDTNITFASTAITIFRAFNSLTTAVAGSSDGTHLNTSNLVTGNYQLNWTCYNDGPLDDTVTINGYTTGPTNYIHIYTPTDTNEVGISQRHDGTAGTGFRLVPITSSPGPLLNVIWIRDDDVRITGIEIDGSSITNARDLQGIEVDNTVSASGDIRLNKLIIHDLQSQDGLGADADPIGVDIENGSVKLSNSIIYDIVQTTAHIDAEVRGVRTIGGSNHYFHNNTLFNIKNTGNTLLAQGIRRGGGGGETVTVKNNVVLDVVASGGPQACFTGTFAAASTHNVSSDGTAAINANPNQTGQTGPYNTYFRNVIDGGEDLHLLNDSNTLWGLFGADLDSDPDLPVTDDIDGEARDTSTPDIGADEAVPTADLTEGHYRWRNDDGSEVAATWALGEDTKLTGLAKSTIRRLRFGISNEGAASSGPVSYQLQSAESASCITGVPTAGAETFAGGDGHSCMRFDSGEVQCWGDNGSGQLGDGTGSDSSTPVTVLGITDANQVSSGEYHTCAGFPSGTVECWGGNFFGEVGDGTTTQRDSPVPVFGITDALQVTAGAYHTCARLPSGAMECWGRNDEGALGDGTTMDRTTPVPVSGMVDATQASAGEYHTCALRSGGGVDCWGRNDYGQVGDTTTTDRSAPVSVVGLSGTVVEIEGGGFHTCVRYASGTVECWGRNTHGQVGDGTTTSPRLSPVPVTGLSGVVELAAGQLHTCALLATGGVACWGDNGAGQLGDGTNTDRSSPVAVSGITNAVALGSAGYHNCATLATGDLACWGENWGGQLGDGTTSPQSTPVTWTPGSSPTQPPIYTAVPTDTSGHWQISNSTFFTDGDPTTDNAGLTNDATTFVAGEIKDAGNTTGAITLVPDEFTEIEFALQATTNATNGGDYCFRLYDATNNQVLDTYSSYAEVQLLVTDALALANHDSGQVGDRFTTTASVTEVLYQFKLTRTGTFNVTELRVNFDTANGVASGDVTSGELWRDLNGNGAIDGADTMVEGGVAGASGRLTFKTDFTPDLAGTNYLVRATVNNLADGDFTTFSLATVDIDESAVVNESGSISNALHVQDPAPPSCGPSFTWLGTPLDVSPGGTGSWVPVDVSATVPAGSTGVILQVVGDGVTDYDYGVRMNGSTDNWMVVDNDDNLRSGPAQRFYIVGVDAGRVFEVFQDSATITTYLVGYTGSGVTFFMNAIDKSLGTTGSYQPIDISADTGADTAIGAIFSINNRASTGAASAYALRSAGSGLDIYNETRAESFHTQVVGVDGSEVAEAKIVDTQIDLYLTGYITSGAVFFTTPLDKSTADTVFVDIDITPDIGTDDATGVFLEYNEAGDASRNVSVRMKGETYDYYNEMRHHGAFVAIDTNDVFEHKISFDDMDTYLHGYTLATCGTPAPTTNYRSIGSAGPYSAFDVAATNGSPIVVGNGTAWVAQNRGRGDHIDIDGADYTILSVDSDTQLTLTEPFAGATAIGLSYTISRQYTTLQAWEDCISYDTPTSCSYFQVASADLVVDNRKEIGIAYNDSVVPADPDFTTGVDFGGSTTDADHDITLTADGDNRHYGLAGNGVVLDNGANAVEAIAVADEFVTVEWLEIKNGGAGQAGIRYSGVGAPNKQVVRNNLIYNVSGDAIRPNVALDIDIYNNIIYACGRGIRVNVAPTQARVFNNTVYGCTGVGIDTNGSYPNLTLRNNVSVGNGGAQFAAPGLNAASSNNLSSDATASAHSPNSGSPNGIDNVPLASMNFVSTTPGSEDLHITSGSAAENVGADLSSIFDFDIDGGGRVLPWDIGADDIMATTAVELVSFAAIGVDGAVELAWETGSELDNLGFHLYRSLTEEGTYTQITSSVIPGLGSSPEGAKYAYRDSGLANGVTYYYQLEDIETTGVTELHGPVSATPTAEVITGGGGEEGSSEGDSTGDDLGELSSRITYGDPSANELKVRRRGKKWMELTLITEGFYAIPQEDGSVLLEVPGFEDFGGPDLPDVPAYRTWQDVLAGRKVTLASVKVGGVAEFASLRPSSSELIVVASGDGTVQTGRRRKRRRRPPHVYYPESWAQLMSVGFQGPAKKALVEVAPLRWDATAERLVLARRIVVRIAFKGKDKAELKLGKSHREVGSHANRSVYARIAVTEPGLYGVSYESVFGQSGKRRKAIKTSSLRLSRQGEPVAFFVSPNPKKFKKKSVLYFLSDGSDLNPYGHEAVYELEASQQGLHMGTLNASPVGAPTTFYWKTVKREENLLYQAAFENEEDIWQWDWLFGPMTNGYPFEVTNPSPVAENSKLRVWLHGASGFPEDPDHHVRLYVNGTLLTETWWDGEKPHFVEAELGPGLLLEGENTLEIEEVGDTEAQYSMVMLDRFEVSYPAQLVAKAGELNGSFSESGVATVTGSGGKLFDTTEAQPKRLTGALAVPEGLSFGVESGRRYLLTGSVETPEVRPAQSAGLKKAWSRAEYLVIGPREFLAAAEPLLDHRRNEGLITGAIATEDIYDEFGYGEATPESIKDFLSYVYHHWSEPTLRYVVLLGDGTYDTKDYLATGVKSHVPVKIVETRYIWTASDPWFGAINGDDILPDVAVGRLPAASREEVAVLVGKILEYESGEGASEAPFVLVADNPDFAGNFDADAEELASTLLKEEDVEKIYLSQLGAAGAHGAIMNVFDEGASLISYMGHGAIHLWANENLLNIWDVGSLSAQEQQPLLLTMNCLNGYFHFPYFNSLSEELLKAEGKGIIAAFSPTGLSLNSPAHRFHKAVLENVVNQNHERLGDAILAGQGAYAQTGAFPELLSIYHLLGDPALTLR